MIKLPGNNKAELLAVNLEKDKEISLVTCIYCQENFPNEVSLAHHLDTCGDSAVPAQPSKVKHLKMANSMS